MIQTAVVDEQAASVHTEFDAKAIPPSSDRLRELSSLELALVGGGSASVTFDY